MTIQFFCPNCNEIIGFPDKQSGKRARCTTCGQLFIIPSENYKKPKKVELSKEKGEPIPGFYRDVFADSWKLFVTGTNVTGLVFVTAAVCFKFFTGHTDYSFDMGAGRFQAPTGQIVTVASWGCLFWYYMEIIYSTALDVEELHVEELPDIHMGGIFGFIWNIVKSVFMFSIALVVVELPCIIFLVISRKIGLEWTVLSNLLAIAGLFVFPMAILTFSVGRDITMLFRPNYILNPIFKAFCPYLVVVGLFVLAWELQLKTVDYGQLLGRDKLVIGLHLLANLMVQALAIISMRSIGLFYRHYNCHLAW